VSVKPPDEPRVGVPEERGDRVGGEPSSERVRGVGVAAVVEARKWIDPRRSRRPLERSSSRKE
jgi:hypothetical protein